AGVVEHLAAARLVVVEDGVVELAHEALIGAWPRLRDWLDEDREGLRLHRRLTEAAWAWESLRRDTGALLRGVQLDLAEAWAARGGRAGLNGLERAFLDAGLALRAEQRAAALRRTRVLRRVVAAFAVLFVVAATAAGFAFDQRQAVLDSE